MTKLNVRLVPGQDPAEIAAVLRRHLSSFDRPGRRVSVRAVPTARPVTVDRRHPAVQAAAAACRTRFGRPAAFVRSGGSIPAVGLMQDLLGVTSVLLGFAMPDDNRHAPNERLHLPTFARGTATTIALLHELARRMPASAGAAPPFTRFRP